jgi:hypothetical protein
VTALKRLVSEFATAIYRFDAYPPLWKIGARTAAGAVS